MLPYSPLTKPLARQLRKNQTPTEQLLWSRLRRQQILDVQFYRQKPIAGYIVDFYCFSAKLVIEIDDSQHYESDTIEYDTQRTKTLESLGLRVIRFNNVHDGVRRNRWHGEDELNHCASCGKG